MNIKHINNNNKNYSFEYYICIEKNVRRKICQNPNPAPDPETDLLFHETDPRIWIQLKIKRVRSTGVLYTEYL